MKLFHSLALLAAFLLVANTIVPSHAWTLPGWGSKDDKKETEVKPEIKTHEKLVAKLDDEVNTDPDDERINDLDAGDYNGEAVPVARPLPEQAEFTQYAGSVDSKPKIQIQDEYQGQDMGIPTDEIKTIHELPTQSGQHNATNANTYPYDPVQSEFVERQPHPTESQGMDPRFANPRQCQANQYLCRKATPNQEHIRCIPDEWKCNGVRDCEENDDEESCAINVHRVQPNQCNTPYQYTCYGTGINNIPAQCIDSRKLCDGTYDCSYGDDESQDRCTHFATRPREETVIPQAPPQPESNQPPQNVEQPPVQHAPVYNPYQHQPQPQQQPAPQQQCNGGKSEEYVKRLEWIDRCFRSCLKN